MHSILYFADSWLRGVAHKIELHSEHSESEKKSTSKVSNINLKICMRNIKISFSPTAGKQMKFPDSTTRLPNSAQS